MSSNKKTTPNPSDFPTSLRTFSYFSSPDGIDSNLLIFLHGLGDTYQPYHKLALQMKLPQTACIALQAPYSLLDMGFQWVRMFNDIGEDIPRTEQRYKEGVEVCNSIHKMLDVLSENYQWKRENIFVLGFSQGGSIALQTALQASQRLGGIVSISGPLLDDYVVFGAQHKPNACVEQIPMLLSHGCKDTTVPIDVARKKASVLRKKLGMKGNVTWKEYSSKGHGMIASEGEMRDVMVFFSSHLHLRNLALEARKDIVEVKGLQKV